MASAGFQSGMSASEVEIKTFKDFLLQVLYFKAKNSYRLATKVCIGQNRADESIINPRESGQGKFLPQFSTTCSRNNVSTRVLRTSQRGLPIMINYIMAISSDFITKVELF
jgi:hypothetical protein